MMQCMSSKQQRRNMSGEALEMIAARFKALSEPTRLKLIIALEGGEKNVTELMELVGTTQTNTSRHLQNLTDSGILARRKEGLNVFYFIADKSIFELCDHVCGSLERRFQSQQNAFRGE
jgi:DNA-binding transcriptional ArsR family regulator